MKNAGLAVLVVVIVVAIWLLLRRGAKQGGGEKWSVLGEMAPYRKQFGQCIDQCNRWDPSTSLFSGSNTNCGVYCESVFSQLARTGIPPEIVPRQRTYTEKCKRQCSDGMKKLPTWLKDEILHVADAAGAPAVVDNRKALFKSMEDKCVDTCVGHHNVVEWCKKTQCPYAIVDDKAIPSCMEQCVLSKSTDNVQNTWTWGLR